MRVFVAGATGAIGRRLVPQLVAAGHGVVATTRTPDKVALLRALGAEPVVVDGLDAAAVGEAVAHANPDAIVHQMTALAGLNSLRNFDKIFATTNRLRTEGTDHLLAAAWAVGVRKFVAQSYTGWPNPRTGGPVKSELDGFDDNPPARQRRSLVAIQHVEREVTAFGGIVLRYGNFYGPGASEELVELVRKRKFPIAGDGGGVWSWCHVDDAASATLAALDHDGSGIYNVADDEPAPVAEWLPYLADVVGAKPPRRVPVWLARIAAGEVGVSMLTQIRGSSNAKAKAELGWAPKWSTWRDGFRLALTDDAARTLRPANGTG
jgi:nucleoside-diphosphate-sugar epimerase